jgi:ribosomal-protein-alanine N-acetyltransferase
MLQFNFDPFPGITTDRLVLRQMTTDDVNEMFFLRSDKEVMKYIDRPVAQDTDEALQFINTVTANTAKNESIIWALSLKNDPTLIGYICLWNIRPEHHRGEMGYAMHPQHHGKGIMHEAVKAVLDYSFNILKLHSIEANVNPGNIASIKLLERNGFVREAYFKEDYLYNGKFLDSAIYSLLTPVR